MGCVLRSFRDKDTEAIWRRRRSRKLDPPLQRAAWRKLAMLDAAETLADLTVPPGNRLEKLAADRAGQHSIRINRQWRVCFRWTDAGPEDVEITDSVIKRYGFAQWPWNGSRGHRVRSGHCEHRGGLSVQAESPGRGTVLMVRRRSTVRFRKGAQVKGLNRTVRTGLGAVPGAKLPRIRSARAQAGTWQAHAGRPCGWRRMTGAWLRAGCSTAAT